MKPRGFRGVALWSSAGRPLFLCLSFTGLCTLAACGNSGAPAGPTNPGGKGDTGGTGGSGGAGGKGGGAPTASLDASTTPRPSDGGASPDAAISAGPLGDETKVVISEIMYHPVKEITDDDRHEFIEVYNRSKDSIDVGSWRLDSGKGGMTFEFPAGTKLGAGEFKVIAKNRKALAMVWGLNEAGLLGDYQGELENKGSNLKLTDAGGKVVDSVPYDNAVPWPLSADAMGVGEEWLSMADRPITKHQFKGRSLERLSVDWIGSDPANWEASPLDGSTPGKTNTVAGTVQPIVEAQDFSPEGKKGHIIGEGDKVVITARFSDSGKVKNVAVEMFDDDITKDDEPHQTMPMTLQGGTYSVTVPPKAPGTLVRYKILAARGDGKSEQVSPRKTDPTEWHGYFVAPKIETKSRIYHLFITPQNWTQLEQWLATGRMQDNCKWNVGWDTDLPATFVFDGEVYDAVASYSGSRYQRRNGAAIKTWPYPGPKVPAGRTFSALSWKVKFPKFKLFEGYSSIKLNKMFQGFPGTVSYVESKLMEKAKLPSYRVRYARLHINGGYYHYVAEMEQLDDKMLARFTEKGQKVGDLFKSDGASGDEGPAGRGDFIPLTKNNSCATYTLNDRYAATYPRGNYEYRGYDEFIKLITDLDAAQKAGAVSDAVKAYFDNYWDVDALATAFAIRNWSGVWDDTFHNIYPYKQPSNGKWMLIQQDFEWDFGLGRFGGEQSLSPWRPDITLYIGAYQNQAIGNTCEAMLTAQERSDGRCNHLGFDRLKNLFIMNFREKFDDTMKKLSRDILSEAEVVKLIDEGIALFNKDDWNAAPATKVFCGASRNQVCDVDAQHAWMKQWAHDRAALVQQKLGQ